MLTSGYKNVLHFGGICGCLWCLSWLLPGGKKKVENYLTRDSFYAVGGGARLGARLFWADVFGGVIRPTVSCIPLVVISSFIEFRCWI